MNHISRLGIAALVALIPAAACVAVVPAPAPPPSALTRFRPIIAMHSNRCLEVPGFGIGSQLIQRTCTGLDNQLFRREWLGGARYQIRVRSTGMCLAVPGGSLADGAPIAQLPCAPVLSRQFRLRPVGTRFNVVAAHSGKCVNIAGLFNGAPGVQLTCNGQPNQLFQFLP
jgi:hypothetical protein